MPCIRLGVYIRVGPENKGAAPRPRPISSACYILLTNAAVISSTNLALVMEPLANWL